MTAAAESVRTYERSPVLSISLPPADVLPPEVRPVIEKFQALRAAAVEASSVESMINAGEHGTIALEADHRQLAEGRAPTHVRKLEQDRAVARARAITARQSLHECWYSETRPALDAARPAILRHAAEHALAAAERWRRVVADLPDERDRMMAALKLVHFAQRPSAAPTWSDNPRQGSVEINGQPVFPMDEREVRGNLLRGLDHLVDSLEALALHDLTDAPATTEALTSQ